MPAHNINLLPHKEFDQTVLGKLLRWALTYGRYIIVSTEVIVLLAFIYRFSLDRKITDLNDEIIQKSAIVQANMPFEQQFRNLQLRVQQVGNLFSNQDLLPKLLKHMENITPTGIRFTALAFSENAISAQVTASDTQVLSVFIQNLKSSDMLSDVNIGNINKGGAGANETRFALTANIKKPNPAKETGQP